MEDFYNIEIVRKHMVTQCKYVRRLNTMFNCQCTIDNTSNDNDTFVCFLYK